MLVGDGLGPLFSIFRAGYNPGIFRLQTGLWKIVFHSRDTY